MSSILISKKRSIDEIVGEEEDFSFPEYTEPNYPIAKSELFDEDSINKTENDSPIIINIDKAAVKCWSNTN